MMKESIQKILARFEILSPREKVLVLASIGTAVIIGWYLLISEPLYLKRQQYQLQAASLDKAIAELSKQMQSLRQRKNEDPHRELKQRLAQLDNQIQRLDMELRDKFHGLIEPRQMANVLESVLKDHKDLVLVRVQSLKAVPLITPEAGAANDKNETAQVEVFRHGIQVEFEGSYLATLDYLQTLENLPWEFYWDSVELEVKAYPRARIVITVHTLSLRDAWLGV